MDRHAQSMSAQTPGSRTSYDSPMSSTQSPQSRVDNTTPLYPGPSAGTPYPLLRTESPAQHHLPPVQHAGPQQPYSYPPMSGAPMAPPMMHDQYVSNDMGMSSSGMHASAAAAALSAQKRAYRQRRKDPSCDACRERKVKCDATDTSSCSECSSRGVKCQFTKETNRRMSSIKQVQDLEKQLAHAKQQISHMRSVVQENGSAPSDGAPATIQPLDLPESVTGERKLSPPSTVANFGAVRQNLRKYGRGIFKPPPAHRHTGQGSKYPHHSTPLPSRHVADRLLSIYHESIHSFMPHLHWPTFVGEYEDLYRSGSFAGKDYSWVSLFFAVLACGSLNDEPSLSSPSGGDGAGFVGMAIQSIAFMCDDYTLDHVRVNLLLSLYHVEMGSPSTGWVHLTTAVIMGQDIGLQLAPNSYPPFEAEMRKRIWWSVYNFDRIVSIELGKPIHINDEDCDVGEPLPVDDSYLQPHGDLLPPHTPTSPNALIAIVPVARIAASMKKTMRSRTITATTLNAYDDHFKAVMASFPEPFPIHSTAELDPRLLTAACALQTSRFLLYRHNLSPGCRRAERRDAMDRLVSVARDTAHYVSRSFIPSHMDSWAARLRSMAPGFFCSHLWRCVLVLSFRGDFHAALTLYQAMAAVGDMRQRNRACGRYLTFFLETLISRLRSGANLQDLEDDEELLAYVSGDLQSIPESAWTWSPSSSSSTTTTSETKSPSNGYTREDSANSQAPEPSEWPSWDHLHRLLTQLLHETTTTPQSQSQSQSSQNYPPLSRSGPSVSPPSIPQTYPSRPPTANMAAPSSQAETPRGKHLTLQEQSGREERSPASGGIGNGSGRGDGRISIRDII